MPIKLINGINLSFEDHGSGEAVVLIPGTGARGGVFKTYQVPALLKAGYRVITVDPRGVPPSDTCPAGFTLDDLVADTAGLIELLRIAPCRIVGFSMGGIVTQEVLVARPELVKQAVVLATRGRTDALGAAMAAAEVALFESGIKLPPQYEAYVRVIQGFSRRTLADEQLLRDWLEVFELSPVYASLSRSQIEADVTGNRLECYRQIRARCLVVGFEDDLITPPYLGREVAEQIPGCGYVQIPGCGHYGFLEEPAEVNAAIIDFFAGAAQHD
jgi:pimeloyl-ACP methyl ester carboxylesterase